MNLPPLPQLAADPEFDRLQKAHAEGLADAATKGLTGMDAWYHAHDYMQRVVEKK